MLRVKSGLYVYHTPQTIVKCLSDTPFWRYSLLFHHHVGVINFSSIMVNARS